MLLLNKTRVNHYTGAASTGGSVGSLIPGSGCTEKSQIAADGCPVGVYVDVWTAKHRDITGHLMSMSPP